MSADDRTTLDAVGLPADAKVGKVALERPLPPKPLRTDTTPMPKAARLSMLLQIIHARPQCPIDEIAARLRVSERTVRRDLAELRDGAPASADRAEPPDTARAARRRLDALPDVNLHSDDPHPPKRQPGPDVWSTR